MPQDFDNFDYDEDRTEEDQTQNNDIKNSSIYTKNQKIAIAGLGFLAIFVVGLWMLQFKSGLSISQVGSNKTASEEMEETCPGGLCGEQSEAALKFQDTDKDGLTDWDELNIYSTSPYIEDSDSDGFSDYEEIMNKTDPNCPEGRTCYSSGDTGGGGVVDEGGVDEGSISNTSAGSASSGDGLATELRQVLLENGMDKSILDQLTDGEILDIYNQSLGDLTADKEGVSDVPASSVLSGKGSAAELRQVLLENGMDKTVLDQFTDEELIQTYQEILSGK